MNIKVAAFTVSEKYIDNQGILGHNTRKTLISAQYPVQDAVRFTMVHCVGSLCCKLG